jgi:hypothetical protein
MIPSRRVFAFIALLLTGCVSPPSSPVGPDGPRSGIDEIAGKYSYSGYDEAGRMIVEGNLVITPEDTSRVHGTWVLKSVSGSPSGEVGPQIGSGTLVGEVNLALIGINLNPGWVDNNVVLFGSFDGSTILGNWQYIGFPGVLNQGTFRAVRQYH